MSKVAAYSSVPRAVRCGALTPTASAPRSAVRSELHSFMMKSCHLNTYVSYCAL